MEREKLDFGKEKVGKLFRALFFPTLVGMLFNSVLNLCDGMFVGHGVGSDALAAINIVAPLFLVCTGTGLMFGIGASVIGGVRLAQGNVASARTVMTQSFVAGGILFLAIILASFFFTRPILYMLGCSPRLEALATDYLLWLLPGLLFFYLQCAGMMLIRLDGSPRYAMSVQIVAALLNIFLDWLMVFPLDMGIKGAAFATALSCIVGGVMVMLYFVAFADKLRFCRLGTGFGAFLSSLRSVAYMARIGFATFIGEVALGFMIVVGNFMFMSRLGEDGVAAYSIGCYLFPLIFSVSNAVAQAAQPIISYNFGAHDKDRVRSALRISMVAAAICGIIITCILNWGAPYLSAVFLSSENAAYGLATAGLPLLGLCSMFFALNITFIGYYQSIEKAGRAVAYMMLRSFVFLLPAFILLPEAIGDAGLWLAIPASELLTFAFILLSYVAIAARRR